MLHSCEKICKKRINYEVEDRREGDPGSLVTDSSKAKSMLGWEPNINNIDLIVESAFRWHKNHRN